MLEHVARGLPSAAAAGQRMREETDALASLDAVDLERADRVEAALSSGVDVLSALARERRARSLAPWVEAARVAVAGVRPETPLALQRAAVQDALRALGDAALVAEQFVRP